MVGFAADVGGRGHQAPPVVLEGGVPLLDFRSLQLVVQHAGGAAHAEAAADGVDHVEFVRRDGQRHAEGVHGGGGKNRVVRGILDGVEGGITEVAVEVQ